MHGLLFEEFKQKALDLGNTRIQVDGGYPVSLAAWNGVSPFADSGPGDINMVGVSYHLDGQRVRVHRDLHGDVWYTLS
jgi:hypothetical protein